MKKYVYIILSLCLAFSAKNISAQVTCNSNWAFTVATQASTCQANGVITVTMGGDLTNITGMQYGVSSTSGYTVEPQSNNVISNLPPGIYTVTVRAFCEVDADYTAVKDKTNVVVAGSYVVPTAAFNASSSRKSYNTCGTGIIAMNVTNGSGTFTFTIASAPSGVTLGTVVPTKNGTLYTLPTTDYPAGDYVILVNDGCYTAACNFTLEAISGFPPFSYSNYQLFYPTMGNNDCNLVKLSTGTVSATTYPDYYKYYQAGLYEVGVAPDGQQPVSWTTWNASAITVDMGSYTHKDFTSASSIQVYTRIRGCETVYTSFKTYIKAATSWTSSYNFSCNNYSYSIYPTYTDYDDVLCYPITLSIMETSSGNPIGNSTVQASSTTSARTMTVGNLQYGVAYSYRVTDAAGYVISGSINQANNLKIEFGPEYTYNSYTTTYVVNDNFCNGTYRLYYRVPIATNTTDYYHCYPVVVTITDSQGTVVGTPTTHTSSTYVSSGDLKYDETYTFTAVYKNSDGVTIIKEYERTFTRATNDGIPKSYSITNNSSDNCSRGYLRVSSPYTPSNNHYLSVYMPVGTIVSVTGPNGYVTQESITTTSATQYYVDFPITDLPAGTYTATITYPCGTIAPITTTYTITYNLPTSYSFGLYSTTNCTEDYGYFYIYRNNGSIPTGSTYTITGPEGYVTQSGTLASGTSYTYLSSAYVYLPAGVYTLSIVHGCGDQTPITATINFNGVYSGRNLGYTTETTCEGMKVTPSGYITYLGNNQTANTFYRLTNGPTGYDQTVKKPGESFVFSSVGTYTLGIMYSNTTTSCALKTVTIEYTAPQLQLSTNETNSYVCVGSNIGVMSMRAINGVSPYTYELWDATNTTKIKTYNPSEYPTVDTDRAVFEYGSAGETFTIRVSDACGNSFKQELTLTDLTTARIVYANDDKICEGDNIQLNCITLGQTTYSWTGPNGFSSNEQNPFISKAKPEMTGIYTVSVTPEFCGTPVTESIYIKVRTCYMPINPNVHIYH